MSDNTDNTQTEGNDAVDQSLLTGDNDTDSANVDEGVTPEPTEQNATDDKPNGELDSSDDTDTGSHTPPDTYADFTLPEGIKIADDAMAEITPLFKELGLTQEQAQKLVDFQSKQVQASSESQIDAYNQLMDSWVTECKNDSEIGGDKFDENIAIAQSAVQKFGTPGLKELLESHGVGNHPEMVRFMVKVGKLTSEDVPGASGGNITPEQNRVNLLYPKDSK